MNLNKIDQRYSGVEHIRQRPSTKEHVQDKKETADKFDFDSVLNKENKSKEPATKLLTVEEENSLKILFQNKHQRSSIQIYSGNLGSTGLFIDIKG